MELISSPMVQESSASPLACGHCGRNCLDGKTVSINFGSNDLLKRRAEGQTQQMGRMISLKWERGLILAKHKLKNSNISKLILLSVPKFSFQNVNAIEW